MPTNRTNVYCITQGARGLGFGLLFFVLSHIHSPDPQCAEKMHKFMTST